MINSVKLLQRHVITEVLFSGENHRCSYAVLIFSIQMAMAIIMLIYVNLSSDTITWSNLTFNLIYVIHSECHKKTITFYCYHTLRVITEINLWIMIQSKIHCRKSLILAKQRIATNSKRQEMVGLFLPDQKAVKCLKRLASPQNHVWH